MLRPAAQPRRGGAGPRSASRASSRRRADPARVRRDRRSAVSSERHALPSASLNVRPIAITSPTRLHRGGQHRIGLGELLEREPRDLDDDVVERRLERGERLAGDVVRDLVERVARRRAARRSSRSGSPVAFDASARRARDARVHLDQDATAGRAGRRRTGCSSRRSRRRWRGCTRARRRASAWYSRSVSVICGATVIESPVCTPIGSTFSIEQITTALSAPSRMTSSSNSFQPAIDSSTRISVDRARLEAARGDARELVAVARRTRSRRRRA